MDSTRWKRIDELFQVASELPVQDRTRFLTDACDGDPDLRAEVESLLAFDRPDSRLIESAIVEAAGTLPAPQDTILGKRLGAYRITGLIGRGGMGTVYKAVRADDQFEKEVAVKLVRRGMDTDFVLNRFRHERQILAKLENPRIARMLDGGATDDGLPYFVMEYIQGQPITEYCQSNHLPVSERLRLFRSVCTAVQYAHQNLIVHRDLKPSNILVTSDGLPKLLDFGIAKVLKPDLDDAGPETLTVTAVRMLTPDYASPEQVRGELVSTATDVYSLGAVLYEMLTGARAHQFKSHTTHEIERVVCLSGPERPSEVAAQRKMGRLRRQLEGDLDNIVMMAMRKEPDRRYISVEQFSEDIQRHLDGLPVIARPDTIRYRTGKFVRRNRYAVAGAVAVFLTLIGGIVTTTYQMRRAERRFEQVRRLANTFLFDFDEKLRRLPGSTETREILVQTALTYLDSLAADAGDDPGLQWELATAYHKVADVQGAPFSPNLGHIQAAFQSYDKALRMIQKLAAGDPRNPKYQDALAGNYYEIGDIEERTGKLTEALDSFKKGLTVADLLRARFPDNFEYQELIASGYSRIGAALVKIGDLKPALVNLRKNVEVVEHIHRAAPNGGSIRTLAGAYDRLAEALAHSGDLDGALEFLDKEISVLETTLARDPRNWRLRRTLLLPYQAYGDYLGSPFYPNTGNPQKAADYYRKAIAIAEEQHQIDEKNIQSRHDISSACWRLGLINLSSDLIAAERHFRRALRESEALLAASPNNLIYVRRHALNNFGFGWSLRLKNDRAGALRSFTAARNIQLSGLAADTAGLQFRQDLTATYNALGDLMLEMGRAAEALANYEFARETIEGLVQDKPENFFITCQLSDTYERLGAYHRQAQNQPESAENYRKNLELWENWRNRSPASAYAARRLSEADGFLNVGSVLRRPGSRLP